MASPRPPIENAAADFHLRTTRHGGTLSVRVNGHIDATSAHHVEEALVHLTAPGDRIVIDLSGVEAMDLHGIQALARCDDHARSFGATVSLRGMPQRLSDVVDHLDHLLFDRSAPPRAAASDDVAPASPS